MRPKNKTVIRNSNLNDNNGPNEYDDSIDNKENKNINRIKRAKCKKISISLYNNANSKRSISERTYISSPNKFDGRINYRVKN
jgi:hypothetical protein